MPRYKVKLTTLSPVHIGNGETKGKHEVLYTPNQVHYFEFGKLYDFFKEKNLLEKFQEFLEPNQNDARNNLNTFCQNNLIKNLESVSDLSYPSGVDFNQRNTLIEIHTHIKTLVRTQNGLKKTPYIPGSTVKGAIKTAILWKILKDNKEKREGLFNELATFYNSNKTNLDTAISALSASREAQYEKQRLSREFGKRLQGIDRNVFPNQTFRFFSRGRGTTEQNVAINELSEREIRTSLSQFGFSETKIKDVLEVVNDYRNKHKHPLLTKRNEQRRLWKQNSEGLLKKLSKLDNELQEQIFGNKEKDPSRLLLVSDFMPASEISLKVKQLEFFHLGENRVIISLPHEVMEKSNVFYSAETFETNETAFLPTANQIKFLTEKNFVNSFGNFSVFGAIKEHTDDLLDFEISRIRQNQIIKQNLQNLKSKNILKTPVLRVGKAQGFLSLTVAFLLLEKFKPTNYGKLQKMIIAIQNEDGKNYPDSNFWPRVVRVSNNETFGWVKLELDGLQTPDRLKETNPDEILATVVSKNPDSSWTLKLDNPFNGIKTGKIKDTKLKQEAKIKVRFLEKDLNGNLIFTEVK